MPKGGKTGGGKGGGKAAVGGSKTGGGGKSKGKGGSYLYRLIIVTHVRRVPHVVASLYLGLQEQREVTSLVERLLRKAAQQ